MNRQLTEFEVNIVRAKCIRWSFKTFVKDGLIELGNGMDNKPTGYLPYEVAISPAVYNVQPKHILTIAQVEQAEVEVKLTIGEFCALREGLYKIRSGADFSSKNAMAGLASDDILPLIDKLRNLIKK